MFLVCAVGIRCQRSDGDVVLDEHSPLEDLKRITRDCAVAIDHILLEA